MKFSIEYPVIFRATLHFVKKKLQLLIIARYFYQVKIGWSLCGFEIKTRVISKLIYVTYNIYIGLILKWSPISENTKHFRS